MRDQQRGRRLFLPEFGCLESRTLLSGQKVAYVVSGLGGLDYPIDVISNLQAQGFTVHTPYWNSTNPAIDNPPAGQNPPFHYADANPGGGGNVSVQTNFLGIPTSARVTGDLGSPNTPDRFIAAAVSDLETNYHAGDTIVLIGHGLGGSSVISVANQIAADRQAGRTDAQVALLALLDAAGYISAAQNPSIVSGLATGNYLLSEHAVIPVSVSFVNGQNGTPVNDDGGIPLFRAGLPSLAPGAAVYLYNRWQTNVPDPLDFTNPNGLISGASQGPVDVNHDFQIVDQAVANRTTSHTVSVLDALFHVDNVSYLDYLVGSSITAAEEPNFPRDPTIEQNLNTIVGGLAPGTVQFATPSVSVQSSSTSVTLTVNRSSQSSGTELVQYSTSDGTGVAGVDYTPMTGTLEFDPGVSSQTITIPLINATRSPGTRTLGVTLSSPVGLATLGAPSSAMVSIVTMAATATHLAISTPPPTSVAAGSTFGLTVNALTANGGLATTFGGPVTLVIGSNPGNGMLNGKVTVNAVGGIATFTGLSMSRTGVGYTIQVGSAGLIGATTSPFKVTEIGVTGDFDGDHRADLAVFGKDPITGKYDFRFIASSTNKTVAFDNNGFGYGNQSSIPVPGDYFGDGRSAYALWTPNSLGGMTFVAVSSLNFKSMLINFGGVNDLPVVADVDGDGKADFGVYGFQPGLGFRFDFLLSTQNFNVNVQDIFNNNGFGYGNAQSIPVVADFDGSGKAGFGVYNPSASGSTFAYASPLPNVSFIKTFGGLNDIPMAVDLEGDGISDLALYGPDPAIPGHYRYTVLTSTSGFVPAKAFMFDNFGFGYGNSTCIPVAADYDGTGKVDFGVFAPNQKGGKTFVYQTAQVGPGVFVDFAALTDLPLTAPAYLNAKKVRNS